MDDSLLAGARLRTLARAPPPGGREVMDAAAIALCMENRLPILVFDLKVPGNLLAAVNGEGVGTTVG